jgi:hypothetical protein
MYLGRDDISLFAQHWIASLLRSLQRRFIFITLRCRVILILIASKPALYIIVLPLFLNRQMIPSGSKSL